MAAKGKHRETKLLVALEYFRVAVAKPPSIPLGNQVGVDKKKRGARAN